MNSPIVTVEQGQVRGKKAFDYFGGTYYSFQGIPYAKPPLGNLRFKAPQPADHWEGVRDATEEKGECYSHHMMRNNIVGSEDCLYLNVYTPSLPEEVNNTTMKAVMVWIHVGGFTLGSSKTELYGPDFLVAEDVVLVTFNYRLGLLGLLSLEDSSLGVPGNATFKDMVLALKWVKKNIKNFSGDPNNVTIFGESAAGAASHLIMLSPMAKGLVHRVISQSGCALNMWAQGRRNAKEVAETLGFFSDNEADILRFLQEASVDKILYAQDQFKDGFRACDLRPFGPVVENSKCEESFLPENPIDIILSGKYSKVPFMIGYTDREGMIFDILCKRSGEPLLDEDFEVYVPFIMNFPKGSEHSKKIAQKIKDFYFGDSPISIENVDKYYMMRTDIHFLRGIYQTIRHTVATSVEPVYFYRISVESELSFYKKFTKATTKGACHADELGYLFKTYLTPDIKKGTVEYNTLKRITKLWTNFAKYGNPNPIKEEPLIPVIWHQAKEGELHFLNIGEELQAGVSPDLERMLFWDEIYQSVPGVSQFL